MCPIGYTLRRVREICKVSQTEISQRMRISKSHVCMVETDRRNPSFQFLLLYSEALNIPLSSVISIYEKITDCAIQDMLTRSDSVREMILSTIRERMVIND